jgi:hypothetical protein
MLQWYFSLSSAIPEGLRGEIRKYETEAELASKKQVFKFLNLLDSRRSLAAKRHATPGKCLFVTILES